MPDAPIRRTVTAVGARLQEWWDASRRVAGGPSPRPAASGERGRILPADPGPVRLRGIDHLEWYVGNAVHTAAWLQRLGMPVIARQGPDTGVQDIISFVLDAGSARLLLTNGLTPNHDATRSFAARGDAVLDVAFVVDDVEAAYGRAIHSGLEPDHLPVEMRTNDDEGALSLVPITTTDDVLHTLVARNEDASTGFAPGFVPVDRPPNPGWISGVTAVTTVVSPGRLDPVVDQYRHLFDLTEVARANHEEELQIAVLACPEDLDAADPTRVSAGALRLVFACPTPRMRRNHLDEFLGRHGGPGVRSITLATPSLDDALDGWRHAGVGLLIDADGAGDAGGARGVVTEPLQARSPLVLALEEVGERSVDPMARAQLEETALAAHRRAHPDAQPLGTWAGGR